MSARDVRLIRSPTSVLGMVLTTVSAALFLVVFLADLFGLHTNPYIGIVFFLLLPVVFVVGLVLIPFGAWRERRRRSAGKRPSHLHWPRIDLNDPTTRGRAVLVFALTMANIVLISLASYRGIEYMDSVEFCGQVCHTVMKPEFVAYQHAPHSRVACVQCHVGPGPSSFVRAKLAGTRRVIAVARGAYPRPIPAPVGDLRPARETCERCHWPEKSHGDIVRRVTEYANDEANTESVTTLRVHVGSDAAGIHWHANRANQIEFIATDDTSQTIPYVRLTERDGRIREYVVDGVRADQLAKGRRRHMDCMDCHNRPSHPIAATPERATNASIASGVIPKTLPFVRREANKALKGVYRTQEAAAAEISRALGDFYRARYPLLVATHAQDIQQAVNATLAIYRRNVFPDMSVTFGTYVNNIGHVDFPGCFRCHDDEHKSKDGHRIGQDCDSCHSIEN